MGGNYAYFRSNQWEMTELSLAITSAMSLLGIFSQTLILLFSKLWKDKIRS